MTRQQARRLMAAPAARIRSALLAPTDLSTWNPAFHSVSGSAQAEVGTSYRITVRGGLTGTLRYQAIADDHVEMAWSVPGFHETGTWQLHSRGRHTVVTHEFQHKGPLALVLRHAYRGVAELRLDRLTSHVTQPPPALRTLDPS